jgi:cytochrome c oxidase subunit 2
MDIYSNIHGVPVTVVWLCALVALIIFVVMIWSVASFRRPHQPALATLDRSTLAEIVWSIIPIVILISAAMPAMRTLV